MATLWASLAAWFWSRTSSFWLAAAVCGGCFFLGGCAGCTCERHRPHWFGDAVGSNMTPNFPTDNLANRNAMDAVLSAQFGISNSTASVPFADGQHLCLSKEDWTTGIPFGRVKVQLPDERFCMPEFIGHVCRMSIPPKIVEPIVGTVAVAVATFHSNRAWAYESSQDQTVNPNRPSFVPVPEDNGEVFLLGASPLESSPPRTTVAVIAPNAAVIADAIAGEALDVAVLNRNFGHSHDVAFRKKVASGQSRPDVSAFGRLASL